MLDWLLIPVIVGAFGLGLYGLRRDLAALWRQTEHDLQNRRKA